MAARTDLASPTAGDPSRALPLYSLLLVLAARRKLGESGVRRRWSL